MNRMEDCACPGDRPALRLDLSSYRKKTWSPRLPAWFSIIGKTKELSRKVDLISRITFPTLFTAFLSEFMVESWNSEIMEKDWLSLPKINIKTVKSKWAHCFTHLPSSLFRNKIHFFSVFYYFFYVVEYIPDEKNGTGKWYFFTILFFSHFARFYCSTILAPLSARTVIYLSVLYKVIKATRVFTWCIRRAREGKLALFRKWRLTYFLLTNGSNLKRIHLKWVKTSWSVPFLHAPKHLQRRRHSKQCPLKSPLAVQYGGRERVRAIVCTNALIDCIANW